MFVVTTHALGARTCGHFGTIPHSEPDGREVWDAGASLGERRFKPETWTSDTRQRSETATREGGVTGETDGRGLFISDHLLSARQHPSYGDCLEVNREYYQNCSVLGCVTQCSQSAAHIYEQFLQVQQIGFVTLGPLCCA